MIDAALIFAFACFGLGLAMNLYTIASAKGVPDKILALDTMVINSIALLILYGIAQSSAVYFEASLLFAMTGFIGTVAYCKFILRGDIIE